MIEDRNIIPDDPSTLFVCSGMQQIKERFSTPDFTKYGSLQSCIRTKDLSLIGDQTHLTSFEMIGNFSFGNDDYSTSCELWHQIMQDLEIQVDRIHIHPTQLEHQTIWKHLGYKIQDDSECIWSDGTIGGYCCELFVGDIEIGNLVNTLGHSVDVGFGLERLVQVLEGESFITDTSLFDHNLSRVSRDHVRTLRLFYEHDIRPGDKGPHYIVRKICRRLIQENLPRGFIFDDWLEVEESIYQRRMYNARRSWRRNKSRDPQWWWNTFGVDKEDVRRLKEQ